MTIAARDGAGVERGVDWIGGSVITDADGYPLAIAEFGKPGVVGHRRDLDLEQSRVKKFNEHNERLHGDRRVDLYARTALLN